MGFNQLRAQTLACQFDHGRFLLPAGAGTAQNILFARTAIGMGHQFNFDAGLHLRPILLIKQLSLSHRHSKPVTAPALAIIAIEKCDINCFGIKKQNNPKTGPTTIGFRLEPQYEQVLAMRAEALGVSSHELARRYLIEMLEESEERAVLRQAVQTLNGNLTHFRNDVIFAVEAILASAGKVNETEAAAWVDKHFR